MYRFGRARVYLRKSPCVPSEEPVCTFGRARVYLRKSPGVPSEEPGSTFKRTGVYLRKSPMCTFRSRSQPHPQAPLNISFYKSGKPLLGARGLVIRDLKMPGRDELRRLPEVNILYLACARELSNHLSAVLVSSRTSFRLSCRRVENVSILLLFCLDKCSNRPYFQLS